MKNLKVIAILTALPLIFYSCNPNDYAPQIEDQGFSVAENSPSGTEIGTIIASDGDGQLLSYEIVDGDPEHVFNIQSPSGLFTVQNPATLNHETTMLYTLTIIVTDDHKEPFESSAEIQVQVTDVNEFSPVIEEQEYTVLENSPEGTLIGTIEASDEDTSQDLIYSIISGNDVGTFQIDPSLGSLIVADPEYLDYETVEQILITVSVKDNHESPLSDTMEVSVNLTNLNEIPQDSTVTFYQSDGNSDDMSGNGYHLNNHGINYTIDRFENSDEAFTFDGYTGLDLFGQSMNNQSEPQSMSVWFKTGSFNNVDYGGLIFGILGSAEGGSGSRFFVSMKEGIVRADYGDQWGEDNRWNERISSSSTYNDDAWHHVVFISNGDNQEAYLIIDGVIINSKILEKPNHNKSDALDIKVGGDKTQNYFTGEIDEIILYNRALTMEEVIAIFREKK